MSIALPLPRSSAWLIDAGLIVGGVGLVLWSPQPVVIAAAAAAGLCLFALRLPHLLDREISAVEDDRPLRFSAGPKFFTWLSGLANLPFRSGGGLGGNLRPEEDSEPDDFSPAELDACSPLVRQFLRQGRAALLVRPLVAGNLGRDELRLAQNRLELEMAMLPQGIVSLGSRSGDELSSGAAAEAALREVTGFLLDRACVTNRHYQAFVDDGGYESMQLWDKAIWPAVLQFVDRTGKPGPRFWSDGKYLPGKAEHPVVGVSWYEAAAYARWAGKRLPSDAEWIRAAAWPVPAENGRPVCQRYPWGNAMDRERANVWGAGPGDTISAQAHPDGANVAGVVQLIGNVWEWTNQPFGDGGERIETDVPLKSIRGGAFDTYFDTQATSQFQSGENPLARKHNVGFRCALSLDEALLTAEA
jgi:iron(II)-dependent oxidoreductase